MSQHAALENSQRDEPSVKAVPATGKMVWRRESSRLGRNNAAQSGRQRWHWFLLYNPIVINFKCRKLL